MYQNTYRLLMIGVLVCVLVTVAVEPALSQNTPDPYTEVINTLQNLTPKEDIEINIGTGKDPNDKGLLEYAIGEPFELRFQTSKDCYAVLMDIFSPLEKKISSNDEPDKITFFLPNAQYPEVKLKAGEVYSTLHHFNMDIAVNQPYGIETLNFFCSVENVDFFQADFEREPFYEITPHDATRLNDLMNRLEQLENVEWAGRSLQLQIGDVPYGTRGLSDKGALPTGTADFWFPPIGSTGTTGKTDTNEP